ncbi:MAG: DUF2723 domain-containing protein [Capsulimonadaceae bacterium]|nr:DUF2723 domain-containing protein [Capsulimonadaceae bacterium]
MTESPTSPPRTQPLTTDGAIGAILFCIALGLYVYTLCPTIFADDCGEIATAAATGGVIHPPGYPLYCLLGGLFVHALPFGEPAYRLGLLSAICAASATLLVFFLCRDLGAGKRWSCVAALALAFSDSLWMQATKVETYALNALLVATILILALRYHRSGKPADLYATALAGGLALTNHLTIIWLIPAALVLVLPKAIEMNGGRRAAGQLAAAIGVCVAPLALYIYEPIAARMHPGGQIWGNPSNLHRLFLHVSGTRYHGLFHLPTMAWFYHRDVIFATGWLWRNLGPLLFLAVIGAWTMLRSVPNRRPAIALLVGIAGYLICNTLYHILNIFEYYTPPILMLAVLAGVGGQAATDWLRSRLGTPDARRPIDLLQGGAVILALLAPVLLNWHACNRRGVTCMRTVAENILVTLPPNAVLIAFGDNNVFPLWYAQEVLHERQDVTVIPRDFFLSWSRAVGRETDSWCIMRIQREHPETGVSAMLARCAHDPAYAASHPFLWDLITHALARGQAVYFTSPKHGDLATTGNGQTHLARLPKLTLVNEGLLARVVPVDMIPSPNQQLATELADEAKIRYEYVEPKLFEYEPDNDITNKAYACHLFKIGQLLTNKQEYSEAYKRLVRAYDLNPNSAQTANEFAYVSAMLGRTSEAVDGWTAAVRLDPSNATYKRNLDTALGANAGKASGT